MAVKILSVDDELDMEVLISQYFRRKIRNGEYEFYFAHNGVEALELLLEHKDIDVILSDINMPEMDGLTLLSKVNSMNNPSQKCIMVSAYGDMGNIRQAMNGGAFDFATKPIDMDDLQLTLDKAIAQIHLIKQSIQEHDMLTDIQIDIDAASEIQHAILPQSFKLDVTEKAGIDICASMEAAKAVGGDFFDLFKIDDSRFGFVIADVSGKGIPAAMFMAVSRTMIRAIGATGISSADCMKRTNELLSRESVDSMFVTTFYGIYDIDTGQVDFTNAGHNPTYILHSDGTVTVRDTIGNVALGVMGGMEYEGESLQLNQGDSLILYTDGVTEAENKNFEQYGEERFEAVLSSLRGRSSEEIVSAVNRSVHEFAGNAEQSDDITLLVLTKK